MKWMDSIKSHQDVIEDQNYYICRRHFDENSFKTNRKKLELPCDAVPTIFDTPITIPDDNQHENLNSFPESPESPLLEVPIALPDKNQLENSNPEIESLRKELNLLRLKTDAEKQALKLKINSLSFKCEENNDRIVELKKTCQGKDKGNKNLIDTINNLQSELNFSMENSAQNEILSCLRSGVEYKEKYSEAVRAFSFKLHCYS